MVKNLKGKELQKFKDNFKVEGHFAPTVFQSTIDSKKYCLCIGNPWIEIPDEMTMKEVHDRWIKKEFRKSKTEFETMIKSSKGKTEYKITFTDKKWNCSCSGFKFRGRCSHIDEAKQKLYDKLK